MNRTDFMFQVINYLCTRTGWTSSSELAEKFHFSVRTIKSRIYEINQTYPDLIYSSNKGYKIDREKGYIIISSSQQTQTVPEGFKERKTSIIRTILMGKQEPSIEYLTSLFCISDATLQKDINRLRSELSEERLNLHVKNDRLSISGLNKDKQKYILKMINSEIQDSSFSIERTQEIFTNVDLKLVQKIVTRVLGQYEYFLDNYSLFNYVLHLALAIELQYTAREESAERPTEQNCFSSYADETTQKIVRQIYDNLKETYQGEFTLEDIYQASILMITRIARSDVCNMTYEQIMQMVGTDIADLLEDIISSANRTYALDLREESFLIRFALHLNRLRSRLENQISISNLQFGSIKEDHPYIYAVSLYISKKIMNHFGYPLSEDEIGYIALHIGVLIEEKNAIRNKIHTILVCQDYNGIGKKVFNKLNTIFSESILITNLVTSLQAIEDLSQTDFIISSYGLPANLSVPCYVIQPLVSEKDIRDIFAYIEEIKDNKLKKILREKIVYFFKPDLFFVDEAFETDTDAIEKLSTQMIARHYVGENYKELIYEHEQICPSSYGNVAVPHPIEDSASTSVIALSINPRPIQWGLNQVNLVFMLSLASHDNELFYDIFSLITRIINDEKLFRKFLQIKTYEEFIDVLVNPELFIL